MVPSKKWQKLFRYRAQRATALKELVLFVHLLHELTEQSIPAPDWIRDKNGGKIYL